MRVVVREGDKVVGLLITIWECFYYQLNYANAIISLLSSTFRGKSSWKL